LELHGVGRIFVDVASVNPNDRDRGLRLVSTVTSAVAAVTLVAIGATTALAASETKQQDELKFVGAKPESEAAVPLAVGPTGRPSATASRVSAAKPSTHKPKATTKSAPTGVPAKKATTKAAPKPTTTKPKTSTSTATTKPKPAATTTQPAPDPTTVPPTVPSTGS
jgi:hypothetical protein